MRGDFGAGLEIKGQHPQVSADFVSAFRDTFSRVADPDLLIQLVQRHHEDKQHFPPELLVQGLKDEHSRTLAALISKADNLSSSERGERSEQWQDYKTTPLMPVLERVNQESDDHLKLRLHARALSSVESLDAIFPAQFQEYSPDELSKHLKSFGREFSLLFRPPAKNHKAVDSANFDTLLTHLTDLVYRYTWCIASNTQEKVPDVSLFDHLKSTAAIATCLYLYHSRLDSLTEKALAHPKQPRFCLAVGDLSGIQGYIFDIARANVGGGVARRLRARSLYVQLCSDVAAHTILHRLGLPMLNMVMNSGGKFYLLLPNLPETAATLQEVQRHIDGWFHRELNGELALNLAHVTFDEDGFKTGAGSQTGFGDVLREVSQRLDHRKQNRFLEALTGEDGWETASFVVSSFEGGPLCRSCGKFSAVEKDMCHHCSRDADVGSRLTRTRYIAFYAEPAPHTIPVLGYSVAVEPKLEGTKGKPYLIAKLNNSDLSDLVDYPSMTRYLASHVAEFGGCPRLGSKEGHPEGEVRPDAPATFECIAHRSEGADLLGFLKVDVDRLGETFVFGLKRESTSIDTISRVTTLSRMLDLFFSGWIEHLTSSEFPNCYTVFSGGDDLFVVGPWNELPKLAERVRSDLDAYTGNPNGITISAGIFMGKPSFPVARAAPGAEEVLRLSKVKGGNRLTIMGHTLTWDEWNVVRQEWDRFRPLVLGEASISSSFLYSLLRYADMWNEYRLYVESGGKSGDVLGLRYQPLLAYNIARNLDARKTPEFFRWADELLKIPTRDSRQQIILDNLGLIASLLIYGKRGGRE